MENYEKLYKESLERAKNINNEHRAQPFNVMTRVFSELKDTESEDEKIRKELYDFCIKCSRGDTIVKADFQRWATWLEKQGESKFEQCIQEGDKIVTNEDGTHFNISQLERVVKKEPKFKVGDTIIKKHNSYINDFGQFTITDITGGKYWYNDRIICDITEQDEWELYEPIRQNPAWSEEDEKMIARCIDIFEKILKSSYVYAYTKDCLSWLKSLKDRVQPKWKPSKEELNALDIAKDRNDKTGWHLCELYKQLKKL